MVTEQTTSGGDRRRRTCSIHLSSVTAATIALVLALGVSATVGPPEAVGFGFVTKWRVRATPTGVATDGAGNVYITGASKEVLKFTSRGTLVARWKVRTRNGKVGRPGGIAIDRQNNVYVIDLKNLRVEKFTDRGRLLTEWRVAPGPVASQLPSAIAADGRGNVYVAIGGRDSIEKYTPNGRFLLKFGSSGAGAGQLTQPSGIATDSAGNVYVAGLGTAQRVAVFTSDGAFIRAWGSNVGGPGIDVCTVFCVGAVQNGPDDLEGPFGVAIDRTGNVFVSDAVSRDVKIYSPAGAYLGQFGGRGRGSGRFRFSPTGMAFDPRGDLYVLEFRRVQKFGEPSSTFGLRPAKIDPRRGRARLIADVPGVGKLVLSGGGIAPARRRANGAGEVSLPVIPRREAERKLERTGRVTVSVEITYTPTTAGRAIPRTRRTHLTLVKR